MTLYEKSINSFLTNTINNFCTSAPAPILTIADVLPVSAAPVVNHVVNKVAMDDNFGSIYYLTLDAGHSSLPPPQLQNKLAQSRVIPIQPYQAESTTTIQSINIPNTNQSVNYFLPPISYTADSIATHVIHAVRQKLHNEGLLNDQQKLKPSVLVIDNLSIFSHFVGFGEIQILLRTLLQIPTISGLVLLVHTDMLETHAPGCITTSTSLPSAGAVANVLDHISSLSTALIQILPPPAQLPPPPTAVRSNNLQQKLKDTTGTSQLYDGSCILSARIAHTNSQGKLTSELISLWTYQNTLSIRSSYYSQRQLVDASTANDANGKGEGEELLATLGDLPFKLSLTSQQQKSRANVELPYAHQGGVEQQQQQQQKKTTSVLGGGVLMNNQGISQSWTNNNKFEDVVSDEEEDEV